MENTKKHAQTRSLNSSRSNKILGLLQINVQGNVKQDPIKTRAKKTEEKTAFRPKEEKSYVELFDRGEWEDLDACLRKNPLGKNLKRKQPWGNEYISPRETFQELQEIEKDAEQDCYDLECVANDQCCPGQVCIILDSNIGHCVYVYGLRLGEFCQRDSECETGLVCMHTGETRSCQPAVASRKQYSEDCMMSSECDIHKGLCCQFQRRHRQAPRKVCSYFKDPLVCIGPVASDQVKMVEMERTAGEKRLTSKSVANGYNHLKR